MNLVEIRRKFRELSGRYDLVNDDFSDNGANFYINEAVKWLDKTVETQKSWATKMTIISAGAWSVRFPFARAVKEVWITTDEGRWQLEKKRLQDIIAAFFTALPANWINGTPLYYSPAISRYIPETLDAVTLATYAAYVGVLTPKPPLTYDAVILSAPVDRNALVEVIGLFYSMPLVLDNDENYWSVDHPLLLIQATIRQTHVMSGNKPMLDVLDRGIDGELTRISYEIVEEEIAEADQMEG